MATLAVGFLLDAEGARSLFWVYIPFLIGTVVVTATIPRRGTSHSVSLMRGTGEFLATPGVALFLVGFTVVWASLAAVNAFYSIQIVALGGSTGLVGIAWAIGAIIEVPIMYAFPRIGRRFGTERLVVIGSLAFALRALLASLIVDPVALVLVAPLEGIGFACVFVGGVTVVGGAGAGRAPGHRAGPVRRRRGLATIVGSVRRRGDRGALGIPGLFLSARVVSLVGTAIVAVALLGPRNPNRILDRRSQRGTASRCAVYGGRRHNHIEEDRFDAPRSTDRRDAPCAGSARCRPPAARWPRARPRR